MNRLIGVGVIILGGLVVVPLTDWAGTFGPAGLITALVEALLVAGVSAWFLRTWWALLTIPGIYLVAYLVGEMVDVGIRGSLYNVGYALNYLLLGMLSFAFLYLLPLLVGAAIGTPIGKRMR